MEVVHTTDHPLTAGADSVRNTQARQMRRQHYRGLIHDLWLCQPPGQAQGGLHQNFGNMPDRVWPVVFDQAPEQIVHAKLAKARRHPAKFQQALAL
ncbi:hypothetical protein D9M71_782970 [compost metagenome]